MTAQVIELLPRLYDRVADVEESLVTLRDGVEKRQTQIIDALKSCTNAINETRKQLSDLDHRLTVEISAVGKAVERRVSLVDSGAHEEIVKMQIELETEKARNVRQSREIEVLRAAIPTSNIILTMAIAIASALVQLWRH